MGKKNDSFVTPRFLLETFVANATFSYVVSISHSKAVSGIAPSSPGGNAARSRLHVEESRSHTNGRVDRLISKDKEVITPNWLLLLFTL